MPALGHSGVRRINPVRAHLGFPQISGESQIRDTTECQRGFRFPQIPGESQIRTVASRSGKHSKES